MAGHTCEPGEGCQEDCTMAAAVGRGQRAAQAGVGQDGASWKVAAGIRLSSQALLPSPSHTHRREEART